MGFVADAPAKPRFVPDAAPVAAAHEDDTTGTKAFLDKAGKWTTGALESAANVIGSGPGQVYAGLNSMGNAVINKGAELVGLKQPLANAADQANFDLATTAPRFDTPETQAVTKAAIYPLTKLHEGAERVATAAQDALPNHPELGANLAAGIQTLGDAAPMLAIPALKGVGRVIGEPSALETASGAPVHTVVDGQHVVTSPNGKTTAMSRGNDIQIIDTQTNPAAQKAGEGTARAKTLADAAAAQGGKLVSDTKVSPAAAKVYDRLEKQGYTVARNPGSPDAVGDLVSDNGRPLFEVSPAAAETAEKDMTPDQLRQQHIELLLKNDVPLTLEQRGSGAVNKQAGSAGRAADTLAGSSKLIGDQKQKFTQAVLKAADLDAKNATPDAMAELHRNVSNTYEDLHDRVPTKYDAKLGADLDAQLKAASGELDAAQLAPFRAMVDEIKAKALPDAPSAAAIADYQAKLSAPRGIDGRTGQQWPAPKPPAPEINQEIAGQAAQTARTSLVRKQGSTDPSVRYWAGQFKNVLDDAFERSASPVDAAAMQRVRQQYIKMKQIEDSVAGDPNGNISANRLASVMSRGRNRGQSVYGRGDQTLVDLANAGKAVLPDAVGNSGTATRTADVGKIAAALTHPVAAAKVGAAIIGGRLINERNPTRGTASDLQEQARSAAAAVQALQQPVSPASQAVSATAVANETPEQRRQRLQLQALRQ